MLKRRIDEIQEIKYKIQKLLMAEGEDSEKLQWKSMIMDIFRTESRKLQDKGRVKKKEST